MDGFFFCVFPSTFYLMNQIECKKAGCLLKGYWVEELPDGQKVFCFRSRHNGENHAVKLTEKEMDSIFQNKVKSN